MIYKIIKPLMFSLLLVNLLVYSGFANNLNSGSQWQSPFKSAPDQPDSSPDSMTLVSVLGLVADANPTLKAGLKRIEAAKGLLTQAGLWSNPEMEVGMEDVGWDASGFSESEITISLSQEFEIFGKRNARKDVALADIEATTFETKLEAFDLYLTAKRRFFKLFYTQNKARLADSSVILSENIANSIEHRMNQGIALQSEFLLAQLELQRIKLDRQKIYQELYSAQIELTVLWNGANTNITVSASNEPDLQNALNMIPSLSSQVDSTRYVQQLRHTINKAQSEKKLAAIEAKPSITMSGGYKRFEANNSNSFLLGISFPLPFLNKNQGTTASLESTIRSQEYKQEQIRAETKGFISAATSQLEQLMNQHETLDTLLLPTAENAYNTIEETYSVGRIPYTSFLEAKRSLIELRFDHNDILFEIQEQLIAIEQISGIRMYE